MLNENKLKFKFTRGIHYFYDLDKFQRVSQSISYAIFPSNQQQLFSDNNNYSISYSKDNELNGSVSISKLINRNYIGLPKNSEIQPLSDTNSFIYKQQTLKDSLENDKNLCHHHLFQAEDKKHNLDRMIVQFRFIYFRTNYFLNPQNFSKLKAFSVIQKDSQLQQNLLQDSKLSEGQKKYLIKLKLNSLLQKRQKLNVFYSNVSKTYYHNSLDQKLFNLIKIEKLKLNRCFIYQELGKSIRNHLNQIKNYKNHPIIKSIHNLSPEKAYCLNSEIQDYYCIDQKIFDPFILEITFKLLSIRLFQEGENCFYFLKKILLKLFNKQMKLENQIRPITIEQYSLKINQIEKSLTKFYQKKKNYFSNQNLYHQKSKFERQRTKKKVSIENSSQTTKLRVNQRIVQIQFYEFYCMKIFIAFYDSLYNLKDFLHRNENRRLNFIQVLASLHYPKFQIRLVSIIQRPQFGLLSYALDKLVDITLLKSQFQPISYDIHAQYVEKDKQILTFLKSVETQILLQEQSNFKRQFESQH